MFKKLTQKIQYAAFAIPAFAQEGDITGGTIGIKPVNSSTFTNLTDLTLPGIISGAITLLLAVVAIVFFFILIFGGVRWIMSSGDEKAVAAARSQITNALIGLAIVFAAYAIVSLMATLFNIDILSGFSIPVFK